MSTRRRGFPRPNSISATAHFAPAAIDATLAGGVLKCRIPNLGAYDGQANGDVIVDASTGNPAYHAALRSHRRARACRCCAASPISTSSTARCRRRSRAFDGHEPARHHVEPAGTAFAVFQDGAIRGLNVAQMIRSLTSSTLSGWQENKEQATDLTQLSASFKIDKGQATTTDLNLVGPLVKMTGVGTIDLGTSRSASGSSRNS